MEEYAETIDFPVQWDIGTPKPHLLSNGRGTLLLFYLKDHNSKALGDEWVALVRFQRCVSARIGLPDEEVFYRHPLNGKGLTPNAAQIIRNSKWVKELEVMNKEHSLYDPVSWRAVNHYVLCFQDATFECVANSYDVEVIPKNMNDVFAEAARQILV
jgi:hypothetical protein